MKKIVQAKKFWILVILLSFQVGVISAVDNLHHSKIKSENIVGLKAAVQEAKLVVSEVYAGDRFGNAVSISGDYAIIGISGDDFMGSSSGTAYIYKYDGSNWVQFQLLAASDSKSNDRFGSSVSISGTRVVVGATSAGADFRGRVYVYEFDGTSWVETHILMPTNANVVNPAFGESVSLSADRILVGSPRDNELNESSGAAYIFDYDSMNDIWTQSQKLKISGLSVGARFGSGVSLFGFSAVIGASGEENNGVKTGSAYVFNLNMNNNTWENDQRIIRDGVLNFSGFGGSVSMYSTQMAIAAPGEDNYTGYVYTYHLDNGSWVLTQKLSSGDGFSDRFGSSVSHANNRLIIGAINDDDPITGISNLGSVYIFDYDAINEDWNSTQKLTPDDGGNFNKVFGNSVAIDINDPDQILIGALGDDEMAVSAGSAYVVKLGVSNWAQEQKLSQADGAVNDQFGGSVSIFGDTAVVGASQDNDLGINSGAVYVFDYVDSNWIFSKKLFASDAAAGDFFGSDVNIDNTRLIVGARGKNDNGAFSGAVYVFNHDGNDWIGSHKLLASDGASGDSFGKSVQSSGERIIIGAPGDDAPFVMGAGSAYIFDYDSVNQQWDESHKLTASDLQFNHDFGASVDIDGDKALVGAWRDDNNGATAGAAYMFHYDNLNSIWLEQPKFLPIEINAGDQFGFAVSLEGDWAIVGAPLEEDDIITAIKIGSVYIFNYIDPNWVQTQKMTSGVGASNFDRFGQNLSLSGSKFVVAMPNDNDQGTNAGAAFIYDFNGVNWFQSQKLVAGDGADNDFFSSAVGISGNRALIGAVGDDNNWIDDGAAYIINVANRYDLKINVSGFAAGSTGQQSQQVAFVNGNDAISFTSDGEQILSNLADTTAYDISITQQPNNPIQDCVFDDPNSGNILGGDVIVNVTCTTIQYELSVRVYGLATGNSIEVSNNQGENFLLDSNGVVKTFATGVDHRSIFTIDLISPQPTTPNQTCTTTTSGTMFRDTLRSFHCTTNQYSIGGAVSGLVMGNELVLQNNSGDDLTLTQDGSFVFSTALDDESDYTVSIKNQPRNPHQSCSLTNQQSQLAGSNLDNVMVNCVVSPELIFGNGFENP